MWIRLSDRCPELIILRESLLKNERGKITLKFVTGTSLITCMLAIHLADVFDYKSRKG